LKDKKKQKQYYSGKKKRHTLKSQLVINQANREIICMAYGRGKKHDFHLFKSSRIKLRPETECLADKGYQGIQKLHNHSRIPHKKPRGRQLNETAIKENQELASVRVVCEHVIRCLKIFKILAERYRNRRKRFGLRCNLIAGLYNYELKLSA
jgi:hypothetical protein